MYMYTESIKSFYLNEDRSACIISMEDDITIAWLYKDNSVFYNIV